MRVSMQTYFNRRIVAVLLMGFASGLPIVLISSTLQAWFTVTGVDIVTIGALSLVGQPYIYKFLWAPLMDRFSPLRLGRRRSWVLLTQLVLVALIVGMAVMDPASHPMGIATLALIIAIFSATQDTSIDAYRTDVLADEERGMGAAAVTVGYRVAMLVAGAGALILAAVTGWHVMYLVMAGFMLLSCLITLWAPRVPSDEHKHLSMREAVIEPWRNFMSRDYAVAILVFIVIYKLCDAFALSLNTAFLLRGLHFSLQEVGTYSKALGLTGTIIGSIAGGFLLPILGMYRSLMIFGVAQMVSNLFFMWMALVPKSLVLMASSLFVENFCAGLSSVAFVAFLMSLCNRRYTATQYALFSALAAVGRVFIGPLAGVMVKGYGWVDFYILSVVIGMPSLLLLWWLRHRLDFGLQQPA
ncbi:MAG: MFS transporter [Coxiellaceae bacterium]|nr:MFS transporter [Coxiellaceae bacterium]